LSRFLTSKNHYSRRDNRVKPTAFLPPKERLMTSTFHTTSLSEHEIWALGEAHIGPSRNVHGRGDITVADVTTVGLGITPDYQPARHVDISGWPEEPEERLSIAQHLAARATLSLLQA
jgi:hypothetical protein